MRYKRLGAVVYRLVDGHVDDVCGDARGEDEVAEALGGEDFAGVFGAEVDAVDVGGHEVLVGFEGLLEQGLGVAGAGVGYEDVEFAEVGYDLFDGGLHG